MIDDRDIPGADPEAVIQQYELFLYKLARKYDSILNKTGAIDQDDLVQVGRLAVMAAQKKYDPEQCSFLHYLSFYARGAMRRALGFNTQTGAAPTPLLYLDQPISDESDATLRDTIPDTNVQPMDESIIDDETRAETAKQVREAIARLRSGTQREIIERVHLSGQSTAAAAAAMGIKLRTLQQYDKIARDKLRRDYRLNQYVKNEYPLFYVGVNRFNSTWTSATEAAVLWREEHLPKDEETVRIDEPPERTWTDKQLLAYWRRLIAKHSSK